MFVGLQILPCGAWVNVATPTVFPDGTVMDPEETNGLFPKHGEHSNRLNSLSGPVNCMKIGVIGKGNVGTSLGGGLARAGHEIQYGHRDKNEPVGKAAEWGEIIILAVPFTAVPEVARELDPHVSGKVLVDVTNALDRNMGLAIGCSTSAAEELQKIVPKARVVKAFNTVFAQNQGKGRVGEEQLTAFLAGDDAGAKALVMQLARDLGFDPVDTGPLTSARYLEPMAVLLIGLGYGRGMGTDIGFKLVKG